MEADMNRKGNLKTLFLYIVLIAIIVFVIVQLMNAYQREKLSYSDIINYFEQDMVKEFDLDSNNKLTLVLINGEKKIYILRSIDLFHEDVQEYIKENKNLKRYDYTPPKQIPWWIGLLPYLVLIILFVVMWVFLSKQQSKGGGIHSFGKAKVKLGSQEKNRVYFKDVAGAEEEKEELQEVVEFLRDPAKFTKLGARIPHGILLVGPPGTGKTLLAKAVAGEAGVPFYSISGSDFVEMYVGVGAARVRDLFETAKKNPASIVFIDEIDAVGRHRGAGLGGGHDEREQTLNQLLVEMDGFGSNDGVIVIAATNRPDILDPALLRPGRFDRQITVNYPDINGREEILKVHARNKPFEKDVDFKKIAQETVGFTGADLSNLLNEAALLSARKGKSLIGMNDIEEAFIKVIAGPQKKSAKIKPEEKKKTAYHEAGHAIMAHVLPTCDPVRQISIIPAGRALGYTISHPLEDKYSVYKQELKEEIAMLLGGRVAEKIIFNDVSGGAANDIQKATAIARKMVTKFGMSDLGTIVFGSEHSNDEVFLGRDFNSIRDYSEETAAKIDNEIKKIIDEAFALAEKVLTEHIEKLHFIANYLVTHEIMDDAQFAHAMNSPNPTFEELEQINEEKRRKSEEENRQKRERDEAERKRREKELRERDEAYRESLRRNFQNPQQEEPKQEEENTPEEENEEKDDNEN